MSNTDLIAEARDLLYRRLVVGRDDDIRRVLEGLADALESLSAPSGDTLTDAEWREFQSIPEQGYSHRAWVDYKIAQRRRPSPVTREALRETVYEVLHIGPVVDAIVDAVLSRFPRPRALANGIDTTKSPALAAGKQAAEFGIRLSSTECAYIAEAVLAASGLRDGPHD